MKFFDMTSAAGQRNRHVCGAGPMHRLHVALVKNVPIVICCAEEMIGDTILRRAGEDESVPDDEAM
jgi:hypothetical protein